MTFRLTSATGMGGYDVFVIDEKGYLPHNINRGYNDIKSVPIKFNKLGIDGCDSYYTVEINSLEDLMNFIK